jgi:hypothetical protein
MQAAATSVCLHIPMQDVSSVLSIVFGRDGIEPLMF